MPARDASPLVKQADGAERDALRHQYSWLLFDVLDTLAYGRMSLALPER